MDSDNTSLISSDEFHFIISSSIDGFLLVDLSGSILETNNSFCRMSGYPRSQLIKMQISDIETIATPDEVSNRFELMKQNGFLRFETNLVCKDGSNKIISVNANYTDRHGGSFFSFVRDITQQKQTEESLKISEEKFRNIFLKSIDAMFISSSDGVIADANPAACEMFRMTLEELRSAGRAGIVDTSDPNIEKKVAERNHTGRIFIEATCIRKNGERFPAEISSVVTALNPIQSFVTIRDITARKQVEYELKESENRFRLFMDNSPTIAWIKDEQGRYVYFSNTYEKRLGLHISECFGKTDYDLWPPETADEFRRNDLEVLEKNEPIVINEITTNHDGSTCYWLINKFPFIDNSGSYFVAGIGLDITDRQQAEEQKQVFEQQLLQSQKLESLGVLAGGIAHDFNNLLAIIFGRCSLAYRKPTTAIENIPSIENAAQRAADLCKRMLAYAGKSHSSKSIISLHDLVDQIIQMVCSSINQNIKIISDLASDMPHISVDSSQIQQVTMNLIINASEAIGESQGEVRVSLTKRNIKTDTPEKDYHGCIIPSGLYACLEVSDDGCGMDNETQRRIFEPFYTTKFTGRGLGMSAVLGIIKSHCGALQLSSTIGHGSTFKVYIPIKVGEYLGVQSTYQPTSLKSWAGRGTVLLVEDEDEVIFVAEAMLEELGFKVIKALNGMEALDQFQQNVSDITLVVTDIGMPVMDGYALIGELKKLCATLPIIITSGFGAKDITTRISPEHIAGMVSKPYNIDQLREVLKKVVDGISTQE